MYVYTAHIQCIHVYWNFCNLKVGCLNSLNKIFGFFNIKDIAFPLVIISLFESQCVFLCFFTTSFIFSVGNSQVLTGSFFSVKGLFLMNFLRVKLIFRNEHFDPYDIHNTAYTDNEFSVVSDKSQQEREQFTCHQTYTTLSLFLLTFGGFCPSNSRSFVIC